MSTVEEAAPLVAGDFLDRDEFLRRWEAMPYLKRAELIRGVVYMPSPVGPDHGTMENNLAGWLYTYKLHTPGCAVANNTTWLMLEGEAPQPDVSLWILPRRKKRATKRSKLLEGAPGFLAEVCVSRTAYDLHQKLEVYQEAGVEEYLAVLMREREVRWHRLSRGRLRALPAPEDGVYRSAAFPGLWLDAAALLSDDLLRVQEMLQEGIHSPEHDAFVKRLAARRSRKR